MKLWKRRERAGRWRDAAGRGIWGQLVGTTCCPLRVWKSPCPSDSVAGSARFCALCSCHTIRPTLRQWSKILSGRAAPQPRNKLPFPSTNHTRKYQQLYTPRQCDVHRGTKGKLATGANLFVSALCATRGPPAVNRDNPFRCKGD